MELFRSGDFHALLGVKHSPLSSEKPVCSIARQNLETKSSDESEMRAWSDFSEQTFLESCICFLLSQEFGGKELQPSRMSPNKPDFQH